MTTHASVELVEAMRGEAPPENAEASEFRRAPDLVNACTNERGGMFPAAACGGWPDLGEAFEESARIVNCPACLALMKAADPVRADAYEEHLNRVADFPMEKPE